MRFIILFVVIIGFSSPAISQEAAINYESMTLSELGKVNTKSLSKAEKKAFKKILKQKKKVEKARIKAEKKRLKAEAKAKKKAAKAKANYQKNLGKVYANTHATKDDFEAFTLLEGARKSPFKWYEPNGFNDIYWTLKSHVYPDGVVESLLFLSLYYEANTHVNFDSAALRGGIHLRPVDVSRGETTCGSQNGPIPFLKESIGFLLSPETILEHYNSRQPLEVQIKSDSWGKMRVTIPVYYFEGYVKKAQSTLGIFMNNSETSP